MVEDFLALFIKTQNKANSFRTVRDKYGTEIGYNAFSNLLHDTKIYGYYRGNPDYCEPYITKEEYDLIQEIVKRNVKHTPSGFTFLFTGLIKCPDCGRMLASRRSPRGNHVYVYYRCPARAREKTCDYAPQLKEPLIESELLERFNELVDAHITAVKVHDASVTISDAHVRIQSLQGELKRLNTMYQKGRISESDYDRSYEELSNKISSLQTQLEPVKERDLSTYEELLSSEWTVLYNALNRENKQAFWRKYIKSIELNDNGTIKSVIFF